MNRVFIGFAAVAFIAVGGLLLAGDRVPDVQADSLGFGFGARSFEPFAAKADCGSACEETACPDSVDTDSCSGSSAGCAESSTDCSGDCTGDCTGEGQGLVDNEACDRSGAKRGNGQGQCGGGCTEDCS